MPFPETDSLQNKQGHFEFNDPDALRLKPADADFVVENGILKYRYHPSNILESVDGLSIYRAQILENDNGSQFEAPFPQGINKAAQYGTGIKAHSVYMPQFQLIPYNRIQDYFADQLQIPISEGSIFNFNQEAYQLLDDFENLAKTELAASEVVHADETGINIGGKRHWLPLDGRCPYLLPYSWLFVNLS